MLWNMRRTLHNGTYNANLARWLLSPQRARSRDCVLPAHEDEKNYYGIGRRSWLWNGFARRYNDRVRPCGVVVLPTFLPS